LKLLLDECVDRRLVKHLTGLSVRTVTEMGWAGIKNGQLLTLAQSAFDIFITVDRNLSFQQHLPKFSIAVLLLVAPSNRLADLIALVPSPWACSIGSSKEPRRPSSFRTGRLPRCRPARLPTEVRQGPPSMAAHPPVLNPGSLLRSQSKRRPSGGARNVARTPTDSIHTYAGVKRRKPVQRPMENEQPSEKRESEKARKRAKKRTGKIKGRGTIAASSRCLHMVFCSTSKIATVPRKLVSDRWVQKYRESST
jgi:Domain of unknown function (DUF5615)